MVCDRDNREAANRAQRVDNIEFLRDQLISEQGRRRNIEHELTQIKQQVVLLAFTLVYYHN